MDTRRPEHRVEGMAELLVVVADQKADGWFALLDGRDGPKATGLVPPGVRSFNLPIRKICEVKRIEGVARFCRSWAILKDAPKPAIGRLKENRKNSILP